MPPIDFCHIPVSIIKRSEGRSAVAAAAYRSGTKLTNEWDGLTHDYTRKGGVVHAEIMLPAHAPPEFADRSTLWNSVDIRLEATELPKIEPYAVVELEEPVYAPYVQRGNFPVLVEKITCKGIRPVANKNM